MTTDQIQFTKEKETMLMTLNSRAIQSQWKNPILRDPWAVEAMRHIDYDIGKQYKGRPVVRDVSIGVQRGEVVGLLGPNGAGKTTCFYVITGLIRADAGAIYLDGEEVTDLPMYQRARGGIGYLPQEASVFRGMSVEDNIMTVLEVTERDRSKRKPLVDRLQAQLRAAMDRARCSSRAELRAHARKRRHDRREPA